MPNSSAADAVRRVVDPVKDFQHTEAAELHLHGVESHLRHGEHLDDVYRRAGRPGPHGS